MEAELIKRLATARPCSPRCRPVHSGVRAQCDVVMDGSEPCVAVCVAVCVVVSSNVAWVPPGTGTDEWCALVCGPMSGDMSSVGSGVCVIDEQWWPVLPSDFQTSPETF